MSRNHVTLHRHLAWNVPDLSNQLKVNSAHKVKSFVSFSRTQGLVKIAHFHSAVYQNSAACRYLRKSILINFFPLSWLIISAQSGWPFLWGWGPSADATLIQKNRASRPRRGCVTCAKGRSVFSAAALNKRA